MSEKITSDDLLDLLRRVGESKTKPRLKDPDHGWSEYCDWVIFIVDGWELEIFNDAGDWDYINYAVAPDGREGKVNDWVKDFMDIPNERLLRESQELYDKMVDAFIEAT